MENNFENTLKERFESFEVSPPKEVWQRIEKDFPMKSSTPSAKSSGINQLWYWLVATMAVVAVVVLTPKKSNTDSNNQSTTTTETTPASDKSVATNNNNALQSKDAGTSETHPASNETVLRGDGATRTQDTSICGYYFVARASTHIAGAEWKTYSQDVEIEQPENSETTVYFPKAGNYVLIYAMGSSVGDSLNITVKAVPTNSIVDTSVCADAITLPESVTFAVLAGEGTLKGSVLSTKTFETTTLQETESLNGCTFVDTVQVDFKKPVDINSVALVTTDALCGSKGNLKINDNPNKYDIRLNGEVVTSDAINLAKGVYTLTFKTAENCSAQRSVTIDEKTVTPAFSVSKVSATVNDEVHFFNLTKTINFSANELLEYHWDFGDGITSTEKNPKHSFTKEGTYNVKLTVTEKSAQCSKTTQTKIVVRPMPVEVKVPNIFTPNNDGQNDVFTVNAGSLKNFRCEIFASSTGEKVAEFTDPQKGWNGKIIKTNSDAAEGIYFYVITGVQKDGKRYVKKGSVRLSRH